MPNISIPVKTLTHIDNPLIKVSQKKVYEGMIYCVLAELNSSHPIGVPFATYLLNTETGELFFPRYFKSFPDASTDFDNR